MAKKLLCGAGAVALSFAALAGMIGVSLLVTKLFGWLYDIGFLSWLYRGNEALCGLPPILVFCLSLAAGFSVAAPAYRSCRAHWDQGGTAAGG